MENKKPNLFIVGAPKCGTTSLHYYLSQHPEILMSKIKEPLYFCKDFHKESDKFHKKKRYYPIRIEKEYLKLFENAKSEKIIGESSIWYLYSKVSAYEIYKFNPNAKIIIMIRNPVDFLYSLHSQFLYSDSENITNFKRALDSEINRRINKRLPNSVKNPSFLYYSDIVKFSEQISRFLKLFFHKQIKIIIFDDFKNNTLEEYKKILEFLNINAKFKPNLKILNPNKTVKLKLLNLFLKKPPTKIKQIIKLLLPMIMIQKTLNFLVNFNIRYIKRKPLNSEFKIELMKEFKPEVEKLNKLLIDNNLINKDLINLWDYDKI